MPFLLGRRQCLGEHFAMIEGVLLLAMIVRRYAFTRVSHEPIDTRPISTLRLARPLVMHVAERRVATG
jgi:cytochrome P450